MATICAILLASFGFLCGGFNAGAFASEGAPPLFGSANEGTTGFATQNASPLASSLSRFGRRGSRLQGILQQDVALLSGDVETAESLVRWEVPEESFLQLQSDTEESESSESEDVEESSASGGDSHMEKHKEPHKAGPHARNAHEGGHEGITASKKGAGTKADEESKSSAEEEEGIHTSGEEHASHNAAGASSKSHTEGEGAGSETASHKEEEEQGKTLHKPGHKAEGTISHAKAKPHGPGHKEEGITAHKEAKPHEPGHNGEGIREHETGKPHEPGHKAKGISEQEKAKIHETGHEAEGVSAHEEAKAQAHKPVHGPSETSQEAEFDFLISRLRPLLKAAKGKELYGRLVTIVDLHEKAIEAEEELKAEAKKEEAKEKAVKEKAVPSVAVQEDLLLTEQLSNMWVLPFYEEEKRDTCLSGFEKLAHEATVTCSDPVCFKLETQAQECHYMPIESIMRKDDFEAQTGQSQGTEKPHPHVAKDHMLLGFDGECRKPEALGSEILKILQHPKHLAKKHALERSTGTGGTAPLHKHHLDLVCDAEEKAEYPSCKTVYEALQHVTDPKPRALPELLVLTDIKDLKNTLGLYRITFLFEGLVQFATPEGTKIDASQHKLPPEEAEFMRKHRHQDISATVMLKAD
ncbi:hypothetical protein, conserved [Eimeria brunetti]|uniref:Rhoptry neck protein RON1 n=1 Tax=Eimeria brunetti TaxID=51314 RepID=U6LTP3_9EIME|nr:hypothetical protein, conserved [Eimeria brunetti]